jgi:transposase
MNNQHYKIAEADAPTIRKEMESTKKKSIYKRLLVVALCAEGKTNIEVSKITGMHKDTVGKLAKKYVECGITALMEDGRKGGNSRNLSLTEEATFLKQFEEAARKGQVVTVAEIIAAYATLLGRDQVSPSSVYELLHRHGWRKIMPRSKHPNKASDEAIEASKKLKTSSEAKWEIIPQKQ